MHADGRVDVRISICQGQHSAARRQVDGRIDDELDPGDLRALDDGLAIAIELAQVQVAVGVYECVGEWERGRGEAPSPVSPLSPSPLRPFRPSRQPRHPQTIL